MWVLQIFPGQPRQLLQFTGGMLQYFYTNCAPPAKTSGEKEHRYGTIHHGTGCRHHLQPLHPLRQAGSHVQCGPEGIHPVLPQTGLGGTRRNEIWTTQLGVGALGHEPDRRLGGRHRGHRHHQPAGDHHRLGPQHRRTGLPGHRLQCRRTSELCDRLKARGLTERFREKTGLIIDAYFSATKLLWILENVEGARARAEAGNCSSARWRPG